MDRLGQLMLHYRDAEAITLFVCQGPDRVRLAAKADIGDGVCSCTATLELGDPGADPSHDILDAMLQLVSAMRQERRRHADSGAPVQDG